MTTPAEGEEVGRPRPGWGSWEGAVSPAWGGCGGRSEGSLQLGRAEWSLPRPACLGSVFM